MNKMFKRVGVGADHAGFCYKEEIRKWLEEQGCQVRDFGAFDEKSRLDYKFVEPLSESLLAGEIEAGILICGTGIAVSIAANKCKGIRAALCNDIFTAKKSREHNDANVLTFGSRAIGLAHAKEIVETWLSTGFEGGRHEERNRYIESLENKR